MFGSGCRSVYVSSCWWVRWARSSSYHVGGCAFDVDSALQLSRWVPAGLEMSLSHRHLWNDSLGSRREYSSAGSTSMSSLSPVR